MNNFLKDAARRNRSQSDTSADAIRGLQQAVECEKARQPDTIARGPATEAVRGKQGNGEMWTTQQPKTDTSAEAVERLIAPIRDHLERAEKENARLQYIKATIRVNAMRNGATEDEILKMQTGGISFIQWMVETLDCSAIAAERDALQAKLDEAVKRLESIEYDVTDGGCECSVCDIFRATLATLKGTTDE